MVDDDIFEQYCSHSCWINSQGYPTIGVGGQKQVLHRLVMKANPGEIVDHINGNKKDCRRVNLRIVNATLNAHNRIKKKKSSSQFHGVQKHVMRHIKLGSRKMADIFLVVHIDVRMSRRSPPMN